MEELVSRSGSVKKFDSFAPILRKLKKSYSALDQLYIELKMKSLFKTTSKVLPFKFKC